MNIIEKIKQTPLVFDGAMGTAIYAKGVFINRCFDELCLTDPKLVSEIHHEYIEAGADVIETNTFGANRIWLKGYGLADSVVEINKTGAQLAREAAGSNVYVGGSVGPCLRTGQLLAKKNMPEVKDAFLECTGALAHGGVDFIMLETFSNISELQVAANAASQTGLPVLASFTVDINGNTSQGIPLEKVISILNKLTEVDMIGMNCGTGPAPLYAAAERAIPLTGKPFIILPNAGQPEEVDGRMLYLTSPEYFTEYAKRYIQLGVRGIGGCCGTTAAHIREAAKAVHSLSGVKQHIEIKAFEPDETEVDVVPMEKKSLFAGKLAKGEQVTSVEILPPRSWDLTNMLQKAQQCHDAGIDAINIPDGPRASARVSPMIASIAIHRQTGIEPILHYCCRDRNLIGMQSDLLGGYAAGIANFLIITGDPPKIGNYPDVTGVFDVDSIGLTQMATNLNHGRDIGDSPLAPPTGILIGVGVNPCAVEKKLELDRFRAKIDAGAEYAITQPIFDPDDLLQFMDEISKFPVTIPIVAGVWPLTSFKNAEFMKNEVPGVEVPDNVLERMSKCKSKEDGWKTGGEIARNTCSRLTDSVAGFQVSAPFGKVDLAINVLA